jgi:hypothetical protein
MGRREGRASMRCIEGVCPKRALLGGNMIFGENDEECSDVQEAIRDCHPPSRFRGRRVGG